MSKRTSEESENSEMKRLKEQLEKLTQEKEAALLAVQRTTQEKEAALLAVQRTTQEKEAALLAATQEKEAAQREKEAALLAVQEREATIQRMKDEAVRQMRMEKLLKYIDGQSASQSAREYFEFLRENDLIRALDPAHLPFQAPSDDLVQECWQKCKDDTQIFMDDYDHIKRDENEVMHPIIEKQFECLLMWLGVDYAFMRNRIQMANPAMIADFVEVKKGLMRPNLPDTIGAVEVKLPINKHSESGIQQATRYLVRVLQSLPPDDPYRSYRYGLFTDYNSMAVVYFDRGKLPDLCSTNAVELFPKNWRDKPSPTIGFRWLCHVLKVCREPFESEPMSMMVNEREFKVTGTVMKGSISVYEVDYHGRCFIAKVAAYGNKHARSLVKAEYRHINAVRLLDGMKDYILEPSEFSNVLQGVLIMPVAIPLPVWYEDIKTRYKDAPDELMARLLPVIENYFDAFYTLGRNRWYHADIRPSNLVVFNNRGVIIDWLTANRHGFHLDLQYGCVEPYLVDEASLLLHGTELRYKPIWDLYSLAYSLLGLNNELHNLKPSDDGSLNEAFVKARNALIKEIDGRADAHVLSRFAVKLLKEVQAISDDFLTEEQYNRIKTSMFRLIPTS